MKKEYTVTTGMIQSMIIDSIYAETSNKANICDKDRKKDSLLTEWNGLCNKENAFKLHITVES